MKIPQKTYVSLFSGAGIGCYGFNLENFECVSTVELLEKRIKYQKFNEVCRFESGYIAGDISNQLTLELIKKVVRENLKKLKTSRLDVMLATPPCQGMSVANHKKSNELPRNSLVIESIKLVDEFKPKYFIFENVPSFLKTICLDIDGVHKSIEEAIFTTLGQNYKIKSKKLNFADYGANSSRTRSLVIGVHKDVEGVEPEQLFPKQETPKSLKQLIGKMPKLKWGEISKKDIYHSFRTYKPEMRSWITDLSEGMSAFDNPESHKRPHRVLDGVLVPNKNGNGDKYKRQVWDKVAPCVHTRNDILASQNTIHPEEDRVFSVRELMHMMTIPETFKFSEKELSELNALPDSDKLLFLKKEELNIRHSIGEAVPTNIFRKIAKNILSSDNVSRLDFSKKFDEFVKRTGVASQAALAKHIKKNGFENNSISDIQRYSELLNTSKNEHAAYYTKSELVQDIVSSLPDFLSKKTLRILEPSVGSGCFIPALIEKYGATKKLIFDVVDINKESLQVLAAVLDVSGLSKKITVNYIESDFLTLRLAKRYDIAVGNPPFMKISQATSRGKEYKLLARNKLSNNLFNFFLERVVDVSDFVAFIVPKSILGAPEFNETRNELSQYEFSNIFDFGEKGFKGVLIETVGLCFYTKQTSLNHKVMITSHILGKRTLLPQRKVMDSIYPTWLIYRDDFFEKIAKSLIFGKFTVFRDRQITSKNLLPKGRYRVLKAANIGDGECLTDVVPKHYLNELDKLSVAKYLNLKNCILVPNLSYLPRACMKPDSTLVDGSAAILIPKDGKKISLRQLKYFATEEFRSFYKIVRNFSTRSMNIDSNYVFYFGLLNAK